MNWPKSLKSLIGKSITYRYSYSMVSITSTVMEIKKRNLFMGNGDVIYVDQWLLLEKIHNKS